MAIMDKGDLVIRNEEFSASYIEELDQQVSDFNAGLGGAISLVTQAQEGDFRKTRFFDFPTGDYVRRDVTDTSTTLTPSKMTQDEQVSPMLSRRFGPFQSTEDAFYRLASNPAQFSVLLGEAYARAKAKDVLNTTVGILVNAIGNEGSNVYDYAAEGSNKTADTTALINGLNKMGDAAGRVVSFFTHSGAQTSLMLSQLTEASGNVGEFVIYNGAVGTVNRPLFVSDADDFTVAGTPGEYYILGLVRNAASIFMNGLPRVALDRQLLKENIEIILQGEDDYTVEIKSMEYTGAANPTTSVAKTGSNWASLVASNKDLPGIRIDVDKS